MDFTYDSYLKMIKQILENGFNLCSFSNYKEEHFPCILRHDIDYSLDLALDYARFESENNIFSTYFVLLTTKTYNALTSENVDKIKSIRKLGHSIGLHFDEMRYDNSDVINEIIHEKNLLEYFIEGTVDAVSMHQPSSTFIESNVKIPGLVNTYSFDFFNLMFYCSDSCRNWKYDVSEIILYGKEKKGIQILTHPIWWSKKELSQIDALTRYQDMVNNELCDYISEIYPEHKGYKFI